MPKKSPWVLRLLAKEEPAEQIARRAGVSESTARRRPRPGLRAPNRAITG